MPKTTFFVVIGTILVFVSASSVEEEGKALLTLPEEPVPIKTWLKQNDWGSKRHSPSRFEVGGGSMKLVSRDDSVMIGTEKGFPLDAEEWPRIRVRLRVAENPLGTDLEKKNGDDVALRIFVGFGRAKGFLKPPISIAYAWTENDPVGTVITSPHYPYVKLISIGQGITDQWVTIERDLVKDFQAAFPEEELLPMSGILLKCDSNNTGTSAEAWVQSIELLAPAPVDPAALSSP